MSNRLWAHVDTLTSDRTGPVRGPQTLPPEILNEAARRLGALALIYAITYSASFLVPYLVLELRDVEHGIQTMHVSVAVLSILASLAVFALSRTQWLEPASLVDLGLVYSVVAAFGIAFAESWGVQIDPDLMTENRAYGVSWACVWIVTVPVVLPGTPGKTMLASLAAATTIPLALVLSLAFGATPDVPAFAWMGVTLSAYLSAGIAIISSRIIYGLGARLRKAQEMGSYRLIEQLGMGGMGEVWKAEHRMLARPAAIKLIRQDALGARGDLTLANLRRRFEREATSTAALASPHTIDLHDFGVTADGRFYYVMELLDGIDLRSLLARVGPLPPERVIYLLRQACHSLSDAHYHGMVHRDIKPANIYVCRLGQEVDFVKVLDFGLVKPLDEAPSDATELTLQGVATGTPAYMAPEMATGGIASPASDLYALGCVGYGLLTAGHVFESETPLGMLVHHVKTLPTPPSQRTELPVPADLEAIIMRCLAKDPGERPDSAEAVSRELAACALAASWDQARARQWWDVHLPASGPPRP